jgi:hypothetical protein
MTSLEVAIRLELVVILLEYLLRVVNGPQTSNAYRQGLVAEPGMQSGIVGAFVIVAPT